MNRRGFLAALLAIPAAVIAGVAVAPAKPRAWTVGAWVRTSESADLLTGDDALRMLGMSDDDVERLLRRLKAVDIDRDLARLRPWNLDV